MKIAVLPGDGIGPEIITQAVKVLKSLARDGLKIELEQAPIGGAGYDAAQDPLPPATLALAKAADAVLLGAVGGPQIRHAAAADAARTGLAAHPQGAGTFRQSAPGAALRRTRQRLFAESRGGGRPRHHDPARTHGGHLFRPAARHAQDRAGRARRLRHDEIQRSGDPPHRAGRIRHRAQARRASCVRWTRRTCSIPVSCGARWSSRLRRIIPTSSSRICTWTTLPCSSCARPSSST